MNIRPLQVLDTVALLEDLPAEGLPRGQVGTVVLCHDLNTVEVEFCDDQGHTVALLPLPVKSLLQLQPPLALSGTGE